MALFKFDEATLAKEKEKLIGEVAPYCGGEPVEAVGLFRRGGAAASFAMGKLQGGLLPYTALQLARKKRSGGMPERAMLAVTPTKLYAFTFKTRGRSYKVKNEVGVWDRAALRCSTSQAGNMTALTIESPAEGEKVRLVGASVQDDPWSQEVMQTLGATSEPPA